MPLSADNTKNSDLQYAIHAAWYSCRLPGALPSSRSTRLALTEPLLGNFLGNFKAIFLKYVSFEICKNKNI